MAFALLPPLKKDSNIAINQSGKWVTGSQNTLTNLVEGLKVSSDKDSDISSIPDIWARPILVRSILGDTDHEQHKQFVAEWRGLLTILAMRKIRSFTGFNVLSIEIPTTDKLRDSDPDFLKVLARSVPAEYLKMQKDGTIKDKADIQAKIQLLVFNERPVAIFWPSTLICPAVDLEKVTNHNIPWWNYDGIVDPINHLSKDEKNSMYAWVVNIINSDAVDGNEDLMRLLCSFRDDIKASLGDAFSDAAPYKQSGSDLGVTGLCAVVDTPVEGVVDNSFLEKSHVLLRNQRGNESVPKLLIVAPDLDKQWNMSESEIIVAGYINAGPFLHKGTGVMVEHDRLGDIDLNGYNAKIHMADEFFTDKIAVCYFPYNAFPTTLGNKVYSYGGASVNIILPIRKWLLDYLTPEYIAQNVSITFDKEDINVTLDLPVSGPNGTGKILKARKTYKAITDTESTLDKKEDILKYDSIPLIQVWPNIRIADSNDWKRYYTYVDSGDNMMIFNTTPLFLNGDSKVVNLPGTAAEIHKGTSFPEAFICENRGKDRYGQDREEEIGVLLLDQTQVKVVRPQNTKCKIGIDFGTTNTTSYMSIDNEDPKAIRFGNHKYYVTLTQDDKNLTDLDRVALRRNFICEQEQPSENQYSIKTMYHANMEVNEAAPFFSGNIYYMENPDSVDKDKAIIGNIKTKELKWDEVNGRRYMEGFLMQLSLQCLVEAAVMGASTIEWFYSYPKAFSIAQRNQFKVTWTKVLNDTIKDASSRPNSTKVDSLSESESVAEYFKKELQAATDRGIICMDIGGGTTDIAVWQGSEDALLNQTSILFAGRDILNDYLWSYKQNSKTILSKLKTDNKDLIKMLDSLNQETSRHNFDLKLEALLRYYESDIFKLLPTIDADIEVRRLIRDIAFALSGVFYYCGMLIGHLRVNGRYDRTRLLPNCYVGGNASKLLHWAASGNFPASLIMPEIFKKCMFEGVRRIDSDETLREKFNINIEMTKHPKQEVALGLVTDFRAQSGNSPFDILGGEKDDAVGLFSGEKFTVGQQVSDTKFVDAEAFCEGVRIDNSRPEVFSEFVALFNAIMKKIGFDTVDLDNNDFINICTNVNQTLSNIKADAKDNKDKVKPEPVFIIVLREAYRYLAEKKVTSGGK